MQIRSCSRFRDNTEVEFAKEYAEKVIDALRDPFLIPTGIYV